MHSGLLLVSENQALPSANAKQKQKRSKSTQQLPYKGGLRIEDTRTLIEASQTTVPTEAAATAEVPNQAVKPPKKAQSRCSGCNKLGHNIRNCPNR